MLHGPVPMTRSERTFYVTTGGYNLAQFLLAPVYPLLLLSCGLDLFEINLVLAVYLLTTFVFDIPTGAVADRFGRKTSFVLACVVRAGSKRSSPSRRTPTSHTRAASSLPLT